MRKKCLGDCLLADRAGAPCALVGGRLAEAEQEVADVWVRLAGLRLARAAAAFVLAAGTLAAAPRSSSSGSPTI
jgi:hypothetical protein